MCSGLSNQVLGHRVKDWDFRFRCLVSGFRAGLRASGFGFLFTGFTSEKPLTENLSHLANPKTFNLRPFPGPPESGVWGKGFIRGLRWFGFGVQGLGVVASWAHKPKSRGLIVVQMMSSGLTLPRPDGSECKHEPRSINGLFSKFCSLWVIDSITAPNIYRGTKMGPQVLGATPQYFRIWTPYTLASHMCNVQRKDILL